MASGGETAIVCHFQQLYTLNYIENPKKINADTAKFALRNLKALYYIHKHAFIRPFP
jgi:hypothetical protein